MTQKLEVLKTFKEYQECGPSAVLVFTFLCILLVFLHTHHPSGANTETRASFFPFAASFYGAVGV